MMLSEKMLTTVVRSILRDRNSEKAKIKEKRETGKHVLLILKDRSDEMTIKRDIKEALLICWEDLITKEHEFFINTHCVTYAEFKTEYEKIIEKVEGLPDIDECIKEALEQAVQTKVTKNLSRVEKSHNTGKKAEEIHGKDSEPLALPDGKNETEEIILLPDGRKAEEIEEAEIVTGDPGEEFLTEEEKKEIQGEPEEQPEEEKKELILNFIEEKGEFKYKAGEVAESTGIETADCTRITINLIEENKIKMKKKGKSGKNGIYGSLLVVTEA